MAWRVTLDRRAQKQLERLGAADQRRVSGFIDGRLDGITDPRLIGGPLHGDLAGYWKYRVGDIRIVAELRNDELLILVVQVGNRREVYR